MSRRPVAVLGATGVAGRQALLALARHPWFEIAQVASSPRTAGLRLGDVLAGAVSASHAGAARGERLPDGDGWETDELLEALPPALLDLRLAEAAHLRAAEVDVVFSMLPSDVARQLEPLCAQTTPVFSTASAFRMEPDTPLLLAGVNPELFPQLEVQRRRRGWRGFIAPGPNCTTVGLALTLAPLRAAFGVRAALITSLQAISGAGSRAPAVRQAVSANVLPWIAQEEEKVERECRRILGRLQGETLVPADFALSATCTRVPVEHGHTLSVALGLDRPATPEAVAALWSGLAPFAGRALPSAPATWIDVRPEPDRPQPRLDCDSGGGLTTVVGRLRPDDVLGGIKYLVVSHNAVMGAAGGAVLLAEDLLDRGLIG